MNTSVEQLMLDDLGVNVGKQKNSDFVSMESSP